MSSNTMISWRPESVIRRLPWQLDSRSALGFILMLLTFSLIGWLYLTQASAVTTTTYRIDELRLELDRVNNQNATIALDIARLESLSHIEQRALELGLRPAKEVRYLVVSNYPLSHEEELLSYSVERQDIHGTETGHVEFNLSNWWINTLDDVTAWLAK